MNNSVNDKTSDKNLWSPVNESIPFVHIYQYQFLIVWTITVKVVSFISTTFFIMQMIKDAYGTNMLDMCEMVSTVYTP